MMWHPTFDFSDGFGNASIAPSSAAANATNPDPAVVGVCIGYFVLLWILAAAFTYWREKKSGGGPDAESQHLSRDPSGASASAPGVRSESDGTGGGGGGGGAAAVVMGETTPSYFRWWERPIRVLAWVYASFVSLLCSFVFAAVVFDLVLGVYVTMLNSGPNWNQAVAALFVGFAFGPFCFGCLGYVFGVARDVLKQFRYLGRRRPARKVIHTAFGAIYFNCSLQEEQPEEEWRNTYESQQLVQSVALGIVIALDILWAAMWYTTRNRNVWWIRIVVLFGLYFIALTVRFVNNATSIYAAPLASPTSPNAPTRSISQRLKKKISRSAGALRTAMSQTVLSPQPKIEVTDDHTPSAGDSTPLGLLWCRQLKQIALAFFVALFWGSFTLVDGIKAEEEGNPNRSNLLGLGIAVTVVAIAVVAGTTALLMTKSLLAKTKVAARWYFIFPLLMLVGVIAVAANRVAGPFTGEGQLSENHRIGASMVLVHVFLIGVVVHQRSLATKNGSHPYQPVMAVCIFYFVGLCVLSLIQSAEYPKPIEMPLINRTKTTPYTMCHLKWNRFSFTDTALLARASYYSNADVVTALGYWFPNWPVVVMGSTASHIPVRAMHLRFNATVAGGSTESAAAAALPQVDVVLVRGSTTSFDWLQNGYVWAESIVFTFFSMTTPFLLPDSVVNFFVSAGKWLRYGILGDASYFGALRRFYETQNLTVGSSSQVIIGHSLGGGLAMLLGAVNQVPTVAFSGVGVGYQAYSEGFDEEAARPFLTNVLPTYDPVPWIDLQIGALQNIDCTSDFSACHFITTTFETLAASCGDQRQIGDEYASSSLWVSITKGIIGLGLILLGGFILHQWQKEEDGAEGKQERDGSGGSGEEALQERSINRHSSYGATEGDAKGESLQTRLIPDEKKAPPSTSVTTPRPEQ